MASSEDTLKMSKNGDSGSDEGAVRNEEDKGKEEEADMEREKEVEVEKGIDPWSYKHGRLPFWWWLTAITLGPILLTLRLISLAVLLFFRFVKMIISALVLDTVKKFQQKRKHFFFQFYLGEAGTFGQHRPGPTTGRLA